MKLKRILVIIAFTFSLFFTFVGGFLFGVVREQEWGGCYWKDTPIFKYQNKEMFIQMNCSMVTTRGSEIAWHCNSNTSNYASVKDYCLKLDNDRR
jgi:hypothetical protein